MRAAALLHDIQTGPFGHSFQYVMEDNPFEQRFEHSNLRAAVDSRFLQLTEAGAQFSGQPFAVHQLLGDLANEVFEAIDGRGEFGPIISGTLDLDNLDNVVRLAFHMGLCDEEDRRLPKCLTPLLSPHEGGLSATSDAKPMIHRWFEIRKHLYEYLLLDRGEFAAKAMLTLAVELAAEAHLLGPDDWRLTDDELLEVLCDRSVGEHQVIGQIVKRMRVGNLFECVGVWQTNSIESYASVSKSQEKRALEKLIEEKLASSGSSKISLCMHYILDKKKTCRSMKFYNSETGTNEVVGHDSSTLLVGAFVKNARVAGLSGGERKRMREIIRAALSESGFSDLVLAPEPLQDQVSEAEPLLV